MTKAIKPILDKVIQQYLDDQNGIFCPIATSRAEDFLPLLRRAGLKIVPDNKEAVVLNLNVPTARKVLAALNSPSATSKRLAALYYELQDKIAAAAKERKSK